MDDQNVPPSIRFIKPYEHRRVLGIGRTKEWRLRREDPDHPQPVPGFGYIERESLAYRELVVKRARTATETEE